MIVLDIKGVLFGVLYAMVKDNTLGTYFVIASIVFEFLRITSSFHFFLFNTILILNINEYILSKRFLPLGWHRF